jgi:hypothetical protein
MKNLAVMVMSLTLSNACGQATFRSIQPEKTPTAPATIEMQTEDVEIGGMNDETVDIPTNTHSSEDAVRKQSDEAKENLRLLGQCIDQWQGQDLAVKLLKEARVVEANQFQNGELVFQDLTTTTEPVLYLIHVNFNVENAGRMELRNPNGWYCVNIRSQLVKTFDINVSCRTVIATVTRPGQTYDRFDIQREAPCE